MWRNRGKQDDGKRELRAGIEEERGEDRERREGGACSEKGERWQRQNRACDM